MIRTRQRTIPTLLADKIRLWTTKNPDSIKLCISSREEDAFMNAFSVDQRLRLHLLTKDDIRQTAMKFLEKHSDSGVVLSCSKYSKALNVFIS
jgi:hypothetical protein